MEKSRSLIYNVKFCIKNQDKIDLYIKCKRNYKWLNKNNFLLFNTGYWKQELNKYYAINYHK